MRRKCRLADTWLTQRVLLDSWNVTFSQGAERCTLNLSLSNNHSPSICLLELNVEMKNLLWKENIRHFLWASNCEHAKLLVLITKCKCLLFFFLFMQTQIIKRGESARAPTYCSKSALLASSASAAQNTKGGSGRKRVFCTSEGEDRASDGNSSYMVC